MVDHIRKQIRDAAVTDLTGLATTGAHVFTGRFGPLAASELPGWLVRLHEEQGDFGAIGKIERNGNLLLEGVAQGSDVEDVLDTMAAEAEAALYAANGTMRALLMNIGAPITAIELPEPGEGAVSATGRIRMLIPLTYRTAEGVPTVKA